MEIQRPPESINVEERPATGRMRGFVQSPLTRLLVAAALAGRPGAAPQALADQAPVVAVQLLDEEALKKEMAAADTTQLLAYLDADFFRVREAAHKELSQRVEDHISRFGRFPAWIHDLKPEQAGADQSWQVLADGETHYISLEQKDRLRQAQEKADQTQSKYLMVPTYCLAPTDPLPLPNFLAHVSAQLGTPVTLLEATDGADVIVTSESGGVWDILSNAKLSDGRRLQISFSSPNEVIVSFAGPESDLRSASDGVYSLLSQKDGRIHVRLEPKALLRTWNVLEVRQLRSGQPAIIASSQRLSSSADDFRLQLPGAREDCKTATIEVDIEVRYSRMREIEISDVQTSQQFGMAGNQLHFQGVAPDPADANVQVCKLGLLSKLESNFNETDCYGIDADGQRMFSGASCSRCDQIDWQFRNGTPQRVVFTMPERNDWVIHKTLVFTDVMLPNR